MDSYLLHSTRNQTGMELLLQSDLSVNSFDKWATENPAFVDASNRTHANRKKILDKFENQLKVSDPKRDVPIILDLLKKLCFSRRIA